jgi:predicted site-specific integrase-resolvase
VKTVAQYALQLGVTRQRVYQWVNDGRLKVTVICGHILVDGRTPRPKQRTRGRKKSSQ